MRHKLAYLTLFAGTLGAGAVAAQNAVALQDRPGSLVRPSEAGGRSLPGRPMHALRVPAEPAQIDMRMPEFDMRMPESEQAFGLTDSERFQLRQQIRDAAQDIYASRRAALGAKAAAATATP